MMFDLIRPDLPAWVTERVDASQVLQPMVQDTEVFSYLKHQGFILSKSDALDLERSISFCVVRDPFDRVASCWRDKIRAPDVTDDTFKAGVHRGFLRYGELFHGAMGFETFCDAVTRIPNCEANPHFRDQVDFVEMSDGQRVVDRVITMGDLASELSELCEQLTIPRNAPPVRNSTDKCGDHRLSHSLRIGIEARYHRDYRSFGFKRSRPTGSSA